MEMKFFILIVLSFLFITGWILMKLPGKKKIVMGEKLFNITNYVLLICSAAGLIITILMGDEILTSHLFEILLIPALAAFVISGVAKKSKNAVEKFDEKQQSNMKDAAAFSWMVILIALFLIYAFYSAGNVTGLLFFPLIIYTAFTAYSGSLIYFYKAG